MTNNRPITLCVFILAVFWQPFSLAAVTVIDKDASPLEISISGVYVDDINPTIEQSLGAYGAVIAPKGKLVASFEGAQLLLDYSAELARFKMQDDTELLEPKQDFDTYNVKLLTRFFLSSAWHIDAYIEHLDKTQRFGTGISQLRDDVFKADKLKQNKGAASLVYGSDTSSRYIAVSAFTSKITYQPINDYSSFFDIAEQGVEFDLAFKQSDFSSLLFRLALTDEDFVSDERQDSQVYQGLLGMSWLPGGKTKLEALIGMYSREFENQDASSGLSWAVDLSTEPSESWLIEFKSARFSGLSKSEITSNSVEQNVELRLTYKASERWHFGMQASAGNTEFTEVESTSELDETRAELNVALNLKEHSKLLFSVGMHDQSYDNEAVEYQQGEVRLMWHVSS